MTSIKTSTWVIVGLGVAAGVLLLLPKRGPKTLVAISQNGLPFFNASTSEWWLPIHSTFSDGTTDIDHEYVKGVASQPPTLTQWRQYVSEDYGLPPANVSITRIS